MYTFIILHELDAEISSQCILCKIERKRERERERERERDLWNTVLSTEKKQNDPGHGSSET